MEKYKVKEKTLTFFKKKGPQKQQNSMKIFPHIHTQTFLYPAVWE